MSYTQVSAGDLIKASIANANWRHYGRADFSSFYPMDVDGNYVAQDLGENGKEWSNLAVDQEKGLKVINVSTSAEKYDAPWPAVGALHNLFGNANLGDASVTADYASTVMGGEYHFDTFTIDDDISVDPAIGWLVIRANTIIVNNAGGATINGKEKSGCQIDTNGITLYKTSVYETFTISGEVSRTAITAGIPSATHPELANRARQATLNAPVGKGIAGMAGSSGSGGASDLNTSTTFSYTAGGCRIFGPLEGLTKEYNSTIIDGVLIGGGGVTGNSNGVAGNGASATPAFFYNQLILNPVNYGQSSPSSSGGSDEGASSVTGVTGVKGGAGIALFCKALTLTTNIALDSDGADGIAGTAGGECGAGGSGGGGGGSNLVVYIAKTGAGTITQTVAGGTGGAGGVGTADGNGGAGANGAKGISVLWAIEDNTITVA